LYGHSDANIAGRVFGCEKTILHVNYAIGKHKLVGNYFVANPLDHDWKDMKFDVVIGNPPYQKDNNSGRDDDNLWPQFIEFAHKLCNDGGIISMVTPASWGSLGSNVSIIGSKIRKDYFDPYKVLWVSFNVAKYFPNVASTFCAWMIKKIPSSQSDKTIIQFIDSTVTEKWTDYPCFPLKYSNKIFPRIVNKFISMDHYPIVEEDPFHTPRASMSKKLAAGDYSRINDNVHLYRSYHTNAQKTLYSNYKNSFHNEWKIVFSYSGTWSYEITNDCSLTDASMCIIVNSEQEAKSIASVMFSAPIKFLVDKVYRWSGYYSKPFIYMIPSLPMNKIYNDDDIYKLLFLPDEESLMRSLI
jgi:hypothetical protein